MSLATYKDLCVDATDPQLMGEFWGRLLGLRTVALPDGDVRLDGPTPEHQVWVNRVPEPRTVKQRVHIDVHVESVAAVEALGATVLDDQSFGWTVMRDPEGGELCVFVRQEPPDYRLYEVVVDTGPDARALAAWWASVLGGRLDDEEDGVAIEEIPSVPFECIVFGPVPEPKTVKNRVHWDVLTDDVERLVGHGATLLRPAGEGVGWSVLADPEGNEFCAFTPT